MPNSRAIHSIAAAWILSVAFDQAAGTPLKRIWTVVGAAVALVIATIALQSLGLAPAMKAG